MSKHRQLIYGQPVPQDFLDALQEFVGASHSNLQLAVVAPGSAAQPANQIQVVAGSNNDQVSLAIDGLWRYISASTSVVAVTGAAGTRDIFATTASNAFNTNPSPPPPENDATDYTFALAVLPQGQTPAVAHYRKIGECVFDGTRILYLRQTLGGGDGYRQAQPGEVKMSAAAAPPPGWLVCDGAAYSRTTYGVLYAALGGSTSPWGQGDGSTTFNVPDLRGRAPVGAGQGAGLTNRTLAAKGGEESHVVTVAEMPSHHHGAPGVPNKTGAMDNNAVHRHSINDPGHGHNSYYDGSARSAPYSIPSQFWNAIQVTTSANSNLWVPYVVGSGSWGGNSAGTAQSGTGIGINDQNIDHRHQLETNGSDNAHNNMPPYVALNYFIRF